MSIRLGKVVLRAWLIDHFNLTPFELTITSYHVDFFTRWFYVVIELEVSFEELKNARSRKGEETDGTA